MKPREARSNCSAGAPGDGAVSGGLDAEGGSDNFNRIHSGASTCAKVPPRPLQPTHPPELTIIGAVDWSAGIQSSFLSCSLLRVTKGPFAIRFPSMLSDGRVARACVRPLPPNQEAGWMVRAHICNTHRAKNSTTRTCKSSTPPWSLAFVYSFPSPSSFLLSLHHPTLHPTSRVLTDPRRISRVKTTLLFSRSLTSSSSWAP